MSRATISAIITLRDDAVFQLSLSGIKYLRALTRFARSRSSLGALNDEPYPTVTRRSKLNLIPSAS
jgi:hypothetical protein